MPKVGLLIFPFWTAHFVVWTPHFSWTPRLNYTECMKQEHPSVCRFLEDETALRHTSLSDVCLRAVSRSLPTSVTMPSSIGVGLLLIINDPYSNLRPISYRFRAVETLNFSCPLYLTRHAAEMFNWNFLMPVEPKNTDLARWCT